MLPYSPLHHLLLARLRPAARDDQRQRVRRADRLRGRRRPASGSAPIADLFLVHDRPIHMRTDDSVVRATARGPLLIRRSRGYVPDSVGAAAPARRPLLACGAELKSTFCLAKGERAWVGHHIGDLENWETLRSFREGVEHFERLFAVEPRGRGPRPAPRLPVHRLRARARGRRARRRPAPPRPPGGLPGRARRAGPRGGRDLRRHRATAATARSGAASCWWATCAASSGRAACGRCGCRAATRRCASRGGWRARGCARPSRRAGVAAAPRVPGGAGALGAGRASCAAPARPRR